MKLIQKNNQLTSDILSNQIKIIIKIIKVEGNCISIDLPCDKCPLIKNVCVCKNNKFTLMQARKYIKNII